VGSLICVE